MSNNSNAFPVLKNAAILQIMAEVKIPMTEAELTEPNRCKERVRDVFTQLLCLSRGLTDKSLTALPSRIIARQLTLDHPDLYSDGLTEAKFFCLLSGLMRTCGYHEFGFRDLAAPSARRFKRQLSALINFLKYRMDMGHLEEQALEEREELFAAFDEVTGDHTVLKERLDHARGMNHEKMLEREDAEAECKEMEGDLASQNKIQASIRQETSHLKKNANELKSQIANLNIAQRELQVEQRQLSKEVVHSPDRIKFEIAKAQTKLENIQTTIHETQQERNAMKKRMEQAVTGEEGLVGVMTTMDELGKILQQYESASEDLDDLQQQWDSLDNCLEENQSEKESLKRQLRVIEKRKSDTVTVLTKTLNNAQSELDTAVNQLRVVANERLDGMARIEAGERRVDEMKRSIDKEGAKTVEEIKSRIASFRKFEEHFWRSNRAEFQTA